MRRALVKIRRAFLAALRHDVLDIAKAMAYSAILCLFPGIVVATALLALAPGSMTLRNEMGTSFSALLPNDTIAMLHSYFRHEKARSVQAVLTSALITVVASAGIMLSLMEGFRRAYSLPRGEWPSGTKYLVAVALIPSCLAPLVFATILVAFGHQIEIWIITNTSHELGGYVLLLWSGIRWTIGLLTTICLLAVVYHFGTPRRGAWKHVLPGAAGAAGMWFLTTLVYGFYITRFADYSIIYGSLGTLVATLVWLYMTSLSVLMGAEFNAQFYPKAPRLPAYDLMEQEAPVASSTSPAS
jgi:membrane protein